MMRARLVKNGDRINGLQGVLASPGPIYYTNRVSMLALSPT